MNKQKMNEQINKLNNTEPNELDFGFEVNYRLDRVCPLKAFWGANLLVKDRKYGISIGTTNDRFQEDDSIVLISHEWMHIFLYECYLREGFSKEEAYNLSAEWVVIMLTPGNLELMERRKRRMDEKEIMEIAKKEERTIFDYVFNEGGAIQLGIIERNEEYSCAVNRDGSFYFVDNYEDYESGMVMTEGEVWM